MSSRLVWTAADRREAERLRLLPAAATISKRAVAVVEHRYGSDPKTLEWIAGRLNTTREVVRQLEARIRWTADRAAERKPFSGDNSV